MEAYALPARPLPADAEVAPLVDLRHLDIDMGTLAGLSPWLWSIEFARRTVIGHDEHGMRPLVEESIKGFDNRAGADQHQFAGVLDALDAGRAVAFYGWWPTAELASVSDVLGVDAMDVPPPDRKGAGLIDGHAVVIVGYGRHDAFPGGGYLIVRNPWLETGWGDGGVGFLPFTYVRAYAIALRTFRLNRQQTAHSTPSGGRSLAVVTAIDEPPPTDTPLNEPGGLTVGLAFKPIDRLIAKRARCSDPRSSYTELFFSENPMDIARAKAICSRCTVRQLCLARAIERREPYGVWGGEFLYDGEIIALKRGRGRPRKVLQPTVVDEVTGDPIVA